MSDNNQINNLLFKSYTKIIPRVDESFKYWYLSDYIPKKRANFSGVKQDDFSKLIINFKNGDLVAIYFFLKKLKNFLSEQLKIKNALFISVPTSKKGEINSVNKIINFLCQQEENYTDCSNYLCRTENVTSSHKLNKSERENINRHKNSISLKNSDNFRGQNIMLIDDVVTSCTTLFVCKQKILESKPKGFSCAVFGRTIDMNK